MRRSLLAPLGAMVLLSLAAASSYAATPDTTAPATQTAVPATPTTASTVPLACQPDDSVASTAPVTTVTPVTTATTVTTPAAVAGTGDDQVKDDDGEAMGHRIRACVQALRDADEHGFGTVVSALAHEESTTAVVTGTPTARASHAEHQGQSDNHGQSDKHGHVGDHGQGDH